MTDSLTPLKVPEVTDKDYSVNLFHFWETFQGIGVGQAPVYEQGLSLEWRSLQLRIVQPRFVQSALLERLCLPLKCRDP